MKLETKKHLYDIRSSIDSVEDFTGSCPDLAAYQQNKLVRRAVEREIEIIGEAINRILKSDDPVLIQNARQIVNTRNWVIHSYDNVDDVIIWGIVTIHLPQLKIEINGLLRETE